MEVCSHPQNVCREGMMRSVTVRILCCISGPSRRAARLARRLPCPTCGEARLPSARVCPNCRNCVYRGGAAMRHRMGPRDEPPRPLPMGAMGNQHRARVVWRLLPVLLDARGTGRGARVHLPRHCHCNRSRTGKNPPDGALTRPKRPNRSIARRTGPPDAVSVWCVWCG
jgi:hypothetical protein